jgi:hypothetical protein
MNAFLSALGLEESNIHEQSKSKSQKFIVRQLEGDEDFEEIIEADEVDDEFEEKFNSNLLQSQFVENQNFANRNQLHSPIMESTEDLNSLSNSLPRGSSSSNYKNHFVHNREINSTAVETTIPTEIENNHHLSFSQKVQKLVSTHFNSSLNTILPTRAIEYSIEHTTTEANQPKVKYCMFKGCMELNACPSSMGVCVVHRRYIIIIYLSILFYTVFMMFLMFFFFVN